MNIAAVQPVDAWGRVLATPAALAEGEGALMVTLGARRRLQQACALWPALELRLW